MNDGTTQKRQVKNKDERKGRSAKSRDTKGVILRSAEELFANGGLHGTSIRNIAIAANVPPALVLYYFKSKNELYHEIFRYRAEALGEVREKRLSLLLRKTARPDLREALDAMVRPWIELRYEPGGVAYARLIAREVSDPNEASRGIIGKTLDPIARRFLQVLMDAVPELPQAKVHWAYHFLIAALVWIMANTGRIQRLSEGRCDVDDPETVIRETIDFFASGIQGLLPAVTRNPPCRQQSAAIKAGSLHSGRRNAK